MTKVTVEIPDALVSKLNQAGHPVEDILIKALEQYFQTLEGVRSDITQTRTWQLCGSLEVPIPELKCVVGSDEQGKAITNYAEQIDDLLYPSP